MHINVSKVLKNPIIWASPNITFCGGIIKFKWKTESVFDTAVPLFWLSGMKDDLLYRYLQIVVQTKANYPMLCIYQLLPYNKINGCVVNVHPIKVIQT